MDTKVGKVTQSAVITAQQQLHFRLHWGLKVGLQVGLLGLCVACTKTEEVVATRPSAPATIAPVNSKSDRLGELELLVGVDKAFALPLPRGLTITHKFATAVHAEGELRAEAVSNFFRARVGDGQITVGASETIFEGVRVPEEAGRVLRIRVASFGVGQCRVLIDDVTPPPVEPGSNVEKWKKAGFAPSGAPLDPKHLE